MALKAILENLEGLSEELQKLYTKNEEDGKFYLQVDSVDGWALEPVQGLKDALSKERQNYSEAAKMLKRFGAKEENGKWAIGEIDPDEAKTLAEKVAQMSKMTDNEKVKEQWAAREAELVKQWDEKLASSDKRSSYLQKKLTEHILGGAAVAAISKHKGNVALLRPHVERWLTTEVDDDGNFIEDADGNPVVRVRMEDGDGHRMTMKQGSQSYMQADEFGEGMKSEATYADAFEGANARGSGVNGSRGGTPKGAGIDPNLSPEARMAAFRRQQAQTTT